MPNATAASTAGWRACFRTAAPLARRAAAPRNWGLVGLGRFAFQTSTFLLHFFRQLAGQAQEPGLLAEMERLSDILCPSPTLLTLIQVKRTLTSSALFSALEEAYLMTDTCRRRTPELLPRLRFQIACHTKTTNKCVHDVKIEDVFPSDDCDPACWQLMMRMFDPSESIVVAPDSTDALHTFLWNAGIANTSSLIERCLGHLLASFDTPSFTSRALGRELASIFYQAERRSGWKSVGKILTSEDVEPDSAEAGLGGVLTGQTPKLEHLRKGYFHSRPDLLAEVHAAFSNWIQKPSRADFVGDVKIPVFWISGRSGEGKSVLLLQLVSLAVREAEHPILQLASRHNLAELLSTFPDSIGTFLPGDRLLAVVDDVYAGRQREQWNEEIREALQLRTPPIAVMTCGPTEQREAFESELCDLFEVTSFEVPRLSDHECEEFIRWFERRTGGHPNIELRRYPNPLLVQLMFELSHNERLSDFARRFRQRLDSLSLASAARTILAVNALYIDAPLNTVVCDNGARDALERLCAEDQLHFRIIEDAASESTSPGVQLAHSHLSWRLFAEWVDPPTTLSKAWARELNAAIGADDGGSFENDVLTRLRTTPWLSDYDSASRTVAIRQEFYREYYRLHIARNKGQPSAATLADWLGTQFAHPGLELVPDPLLNAVSRLNEKSAGSYLPASVAAWVLILSERHDGSTAEAIRDAAKGFFEAAPASPDVPRALGLVLAHGVAETALPIICRWLEKHGTTANAHVLLCRRSLSESIDSRIFQRLVLTWLASNPDHPQTFFVLAPLVASSAGNPAVLAQALQWIERSQSDPHQPFVLAALVRAHPWNEDVRKCVRRWISRFPRHIESPNVLGTLVAACRKDSTVAKFALSWLDANGNEPNAWWVLCPLIKGRCGGQLAFKFTLKWLGEKLSDPHARLVLAALTAAYPANPAISAIIKRWLLLEPAHAEEVLHPWLRQNPLDRSIKEVVLSWFDNHRDTTGGATVLAALIKCFPTEEAIQRRVTDWFSHRKADSSSREGVQQLLEYNDDLDLVVRLSETWLDKFNDLADPELYRILQRLLRARPNAPAICNTALRWLRSNRDHSRHDAVTASIHRSFAGHAEADAYVITWLDEGFGPEQWRRLQALLDERISTTIVKERGSQWLRTYRDHPHWITFLIAMIRKFAADSAVAGFAKDWLGTNYQDRRAGRLYPYMLRSGYLDDACMRQASSWLEAFPDHEQVPHVIEALVRAGCATCTHALDRYLRLIEESHDVTVKHELRRAIARALVRNGELIRNYLCERFSEMQRQALCDLVVSAVKWNSFAIATDELNYLNTLPDQFRFYIALQFVLRRVYGTEVDSFLVKWLADHAGKRGQREFQYRRVVQALRRDLQRVDRLEVDSGLKSAIVDDIRL